MNIQDFPLKSDQKMPNIKNLLDHQVIFEHLKAFLLNLVEKHFE